MILFWLLKWTCPGLKSEKIGDLLLHTAIRVKYYTHIFLHKGLSRLLNHHNNNTIRVCDGSLFSKTKLPKHTAIRVKSYTHIFLHKGLSRLLNHHNNNTIRVCDGSRPHDPSFPRLNCLNILRLESNITPIFFLHKGLSRLLNHHNNHKSP